MSNIRYTAWCTKCGEPHTSDNLKFDCFECEHCKHVQEAKNGRWLEKGEIPVSRTQFEGSGSPRTRLYELHQLLCLNALELMKIKNQDYGGDTDPFRNFHTFGELGILVRLSDKLARLRTYCERGDLKVKDESVEDTCIDAINYLVLLMGYIKREEIYGKDDKDPR